jgi:HD-like signal output (HDOD) protein
MLPSTLREVLLDIEGLPTLPVFIQHLLGALGEEDHTAEDLEKFIIKDPAISARILRVANSSFFGLQGRVGSLKHAIVLLGTPLIQSLALSTSLIDVLAYNKTVGYVPWRAYWIHSFACAWVCQRLVQRGFYREVNKEAFICGLLHDLGKPVLWIYEAVAYQEVLRKMQLAGLDAHMAETEVLGAHHGEVGGELAVWWKLPETIQEAIRYHHEGFSEKPAASLVQLADKLASSEGFCDEFQPRGSIAAGIGMSTTISAAQLAQVIEELRGKHNEIRDVAEFLR